MAKINKGADPTRSKTVRKRAVSKINNKFSKFKKASKDYILKESGYSPAWSIEKMSRFRFWLDDEIATQLLNPTTARGKQWLLSFIEMGYDKGVRQTRNFFKRFDKISDMTFDSLLNENHRLRAEIIYTRAYDNLEGVTKTMASQMSDRLAVGVLKGKGIREIAKDVGERVDKIGAVRARLIARTEIVQAHNIASVQEAENIGRITGKNYKMQWITSMDGRERPSHLARNGKIYTQKQVLQLLGEPNCRCATTAYSEDWDID